MLFFFENAHSAKILSQMLLMVERNLFRDLWSSFQRFQRPLQRTPSALQHVSRPFFEVTPSFGCTSSQSLIDYSSSRMVASRPTHIGSCRSSSKRDFTAMQSTAAAVPPCKKRAAAALRSCWTSLTFFRVNSGALISAIKMNI